MQLLLCLYRNGFVAENFVHETNIFCIFFMCTFFAAFTVRSIIAHAIPFQWLRVCVCVCDVGAIRVLEPGLHGGKNRFFFQSDDESQIMSGSFVRKVHTMQLLLRCTYSDSQTCTHLPTTRQRCVHFHFHSRQFICTISWRERFVCFFIAHQPRELFVLFFSTVDMPCIELNVVACQIAIWQYIFGFCFWSFASFAATRKLNGEQENDYNFIKVWWVSQKWIWNCWNSILWNEWRTHSHTPFLVAAASECDASKSNSRTHRLNHV